LWCRRGADGGRRLLAAKRPQSTANTTILMILMQLESFYVRSTSCGILGNAEMLQDLDGFAQ